jgi:hypothetical protein
MGSDELGRWRDALIIDRDNTLIETARRWIGEVKTPFNKHELVSRLESFIRRPATIDAMIGLLDRLDRRVVALALFSGTAASAGIALGDLVELASDDSSTQAATASRIRNLRERLIVYAYHGDRGGEYINVVPPLVQRLLTELTPSDALSAVKPADEPSADDPLALFCALVSASAHARPAFKGRREPSKRMITLLEGTAPVLAADRDRLVFFMDALTVCGILGDGADGHPSVDPRRFVVSCEQAGEAAIFVLAAGAIAGKTMERCLATGLIRAVIESLPRRVAFTPTDARRIVSMAARRYLEREAVAGVPAAISALDRGVAGISSALTETLTAMGILVSDADGMVRAAGESFAPRRAAMQKSVIVEESHEIRILPEADTATRAFISVVARLDRTGLVWSATLDKSAAKTAYAYGFTAREIASRLEQASGTGLPQSVRFSLDAWEAEASSAKVRVGVVVVLDGHLSGVLEHSPKAAGIVAEKLADGVYLLAAAGGADAERLLRSVGIEVDLRSAPAHPDETALSELWSETGSTQDEPPPVETLAFPPVADTLEAGEAPLVTRLLSALDGMKLSSGDKSDLADRIRGRLILDESQMAKPVPVVDNTVIGALDYPGKLRLIEQAMKDGVAIELAYADEAGIQALVSGIPRDIRRTPAGTVVQLSTEGGTSLVVAVSAVERARRLRSIPFGAYNEHEQGL